MTEEPDPPVTLELLDQRLADVEAQAARRSTWTLVGLLGALAVSMLLHAAASVDAAQAQQRAARVCADQPWAPPPTTTRSPDPPP